MVQMHLPIVLLLQMVSCRQLFPFIIDLLFVVNTYLLLGRIPVRLYLWTVSEEFDDFEDAPQIDNWDKVTYINRPVELHKEDGKSCLEENPPLELLN